MIVIVDYNMGNVGSIQNMLKKIGVKCCISASLDEIYKAEKLIIPGVGSFDEGMSNLENAGLIPAINHMAIKEKIPVLGICLGMQLMTHQSEEGVLPGLGWIQAETVKLKKIEGLKIPHMGWNTVSVEKKNYITENLNEDTRFYFVHSYHVVCRDKEDILFKTNYGIDFVSAFQKNNIVGVQFHPEKSHKHGMKLLENWVKGI